MCTRGAPVARSSVFSPRQTSVVDVPRAYEQIGIPEGVGPCQAAGAGRAVDARGRYVVADEIAVTAASARTAETQKDSGLMPDTDIDVFER
jgi:hypothetical protein